MEMKDNRISAIIFLIIAAIVGIYTSIKVGGQSLFWIDAKVAGFLGNISDSAIPFFIHVTEMGGKKGIGVVALLMLAWLLLKRKNYLGAAVLALSIAIGNEVNKLLKNLFERPRPDLEHHVIEKSYSFPSGHAMVGMITYFIIAYLLIEAVKSKSIKILIGALAAILLLLIGASRIILHVHYPSDILAGYAFGYIWLIIWILIYNFFKKRVL